MAHPMKQWNNTIIIIILLLLLWLLYYIRRIVVEIYIGGIRRESYGIKILYTHFTQLARKKCIYI